MKQTIIGTGLSGLVGSRITELLGDRYFFVDLSLTTGIDITDREVVLSQMKNSDANWILHMAAKADVDGCEKDKTADKNGAAWLINVEGTRNIVGAAETFGKRVLYISTDFVFAGKQDFYRETDTPDPINWYGVTKHEGEKLVLTNPNNLILRLAYPYLAKCGGPKRDFVHTLYHKLEKDEKVTVVRDHIFTPTFVDDIARAIDLLIANSASGIYHGVGSQSLSPFEAASLITQQFGFNKELLTGVTAHEFYQNRAPRPLELRLKNDKIAALGLNMQTFNEGLEEVKRQGIN